MGEVYRARDTRLDRDVALKVLPGDLAEDPTRLERFEREAKTVAGLNEGFLEKKRLVIAVDVFVNPTPAGSECVLDTNIILPDRCVGDCDPIACPPTETVPYMIFFTQASACPDICVDID